MSKFLSGRQSNLKLGVDGYTNSKTVLETTGRVAIGATDAQSYSLFVEGDTSVQNIRITSGISTDGVDYGETFQLLRATGSGTWEWATVSGLFTANNILNGFTVREEGTVVGTAASIIQLDFRGSNIIASADPQPNGIATITMSDSPTFDNLLVTGISSVGTGITMYASSGIISATKFFGDGSELANTGATLNPAAGTQRLVVTSLTSGTMIDAATDSDLTYNATTDTLNVLNLDVSGHTELDSVNVSGILTASSIQIIGGGGFSTQDNLTNLFVSGISTFNGIVDINSNLDVDGQTELDHLSVTGISTFANTVVVNALLDANSDVDISGNLDVDGTTELDGLNVDGNTTLDTVTVGQLTVSGLTDLNGNLDVDGQTELDHISVTGVSTFSNNIDANGDLDVDGHTELDNLNVSGVSTFTSVVNLNGGLDVSGHTELDSVNVSGVVTATEFHTGAEASSIRINSTTISGPSVINIDPAGIGDNTGKVVIKGDFQVTGTETIVDSTTVTINDKNIVVAEGSADDTQADGGGITIESGDGNKTFQFEATGDNLGSSEHLNLAAGKRYKINNIGVLSANGLGSGVVNSSLTSVGTLNQLNVSGISTFGNIVDINAGLDVDGHTDLDNLSVAGVSTFASLVDIDGGGRANTFIVEDLTDNRIVLAGPGGELEDDANLTFNGSQLAVGSAITAYVASGIVSATAFYGDGSNLDNTGATLNAAAGTQRLVVTSLTSGTMVDAATDGDLTFDATNNTLNTYNLKVSAGISTDGADFGQDGQLLRANSGGKWSWAFVPGIFSVNNILNGFNVLEEGTTVGTAGSIQTLDFRGNNIIATADPAPNGIATVTVSDTPTFDSLTVTGQTELNQLSVTGVSTFGSSSVTIDGNSDLINVGTALTLGHSQGLQFHSQNLHRDGFDVNQINASGIVTALEFHGDGSTLTGIAVTDNVRTDSLEVVGVTTFLDNIHVGSAITMYAATGIISATQLYGDGSQLTGITAGAILGASSGTQRLVMTNITSGTMFNAATDSDLAYDSVSDRLVVPNIDVSGIATLGGPLSTGSTTGVEGQYLKSTGVGVTWATFPRVRNVGINTAVAGQTSFNFTYNPEFLDVFVNGVKLTPSEYTASNGSQITLQTPAFAGEIVEFHTYNATSVGGGGGGGGGGGITEVVSDTSPQLGGELDLNGFGISGTGIITATSFTGNGANLTNLNASNITSGSIPSSAFPGILPAINGQNLTNVLHDIVDDTTPELGGDLDLNGNNIVGTGSIQISGSITATSLAGIGSNVSGILTTNIVNYGNGITDGLISLPDLSVTTAGTPLQLGALAYNNTNGVFTFTPPDIEGQSRQALSVGTANTPLQIGAISYNNGTGVFTYTPPDLSSYVQSNSSPTFTNITATNVSASSSITAATLFGDASNVTGIVTTNIGKANVTISDNPPGIGTAHGDLWWESDTAKGHIYYNDGNSAQWVEFNPATGGAGGGGYADVDVDTHLNQSTAATNELLSWNGSDYDWVSDINVGNINASGNLNVAGVLTYEDVTNVDSIGIITARSGIDATGTVTATTFSGSGSSLTSLNASQLSSGTIPDARFPATLPAVSGANLTNLDASDLASGTIPDARFPATLPTVSGANLTNLSSSQLTGALPAIDGSALTNLPSTGGTPTWTLGANGSSDYTFTGPGVASGSQDPTIYLVRGQSYKFENRSGGHPFRIQYQFQNTGGTAYTDGITISDGGAASSGANHNTDLLWDVRFDAPDVLYYQCTSHQNMSGKIVILGDTKINGSWSASAGTAQVIDTITGVSNNAIKTAEYTIHIENGGNMQSQKILVMQNGTSAHHQEYAVMYTSTNPLVELSADINSGNLRLLATPATGISGTTTYTFTRQTIR